MPWHLCPNCGKVVDVDPYAEACPECRVHIPVPPHERGWMGPPPPGPGPLPPRAYAPPGYAPPGYGPAGYAAPGGPPVERVRRSPEGPEGIDVQELMEKYEELQKENARLRKELAKKER